MDKLIGCWKCKDNFDNNFRIEMNKGDGQSKDGLKLVCLNRKNVDIDIAVTPIIKNQYSIVCDSFEGNKITFVSHNTIEIDGKRYQKIFDDSGLCNYSAEQCIFSK